MPTNGTRTLPDTSFAAIAFELKLLARRDAAAIEDFEYFMAGLEQPSPGLEFTLADLRQSLAVIADAYEVFSVLATREREVRALDAPRPAPTIEEDRLCRPQDWKSRLRASLAACWRSFVSSVLSGR